ncbi:MAG: hypothetical protein PHQ54_02685 [Candidatus Omnitrophica bacterium]|nr:hypothetical protein [Candidatus Omnitrophota bacterium]
MAHYSNRKIAFIFLFIFSVLSFCGLISEARRIQDVSPQYQITPEGNSLFGKPSYRLNEDGTIQVDGKTLLLPFRGGYTAYQVEPGRLLLISDKTGLAEFYINIRWAPADSEVIDVLGEGLLEVLDRFEDPFGYVPFLSVYTISEIEQEVIRVCQEHADRSIVDGLLTKVDFWEWSQIARIAAKFGLDRVLNYFDKFLVLGNNDQDKQSLFLDAVYYLLDGESSPEYALYAIESLPLSEGSAGAASFAFEYIKTIRDKVHILRDQIPAYARAASTESRGIILGSAVSSQARELLERMRHDLEQGLRTIVKVSSAITMRYSIEQQAPPFFDTTPGLIANIRSVFEYLLSFVSGEYSPVLLVAGSSGEAITFDYGTPVLFALLEGIPLNPSTVKPLTGEVRVSIDDFGRMKYTRDLSDMRKMRVFYIADLDLADLGLVHLISMLWWKDGVGYEGSGDIGFRLNARIPGAQAPNLLRIEKHPANHRRTFHMNLDGDYMREYQSELDQLLASLTQGLPIPPALVARDWEGNHYSMNRTNDMLDPMSDSDIRILLEEVFQLLCPLLPPLN